MSWRGWLMLFLLAGAVAAGWSVWTQRKTVAPEALAARSDYVLNDFEIVSLDREGKEAFTVRAPRMERDPADKSMDLETPLFLVPDQQGRHWEVRSKTARVDDGGDAIALAGNVLATSPEGGDTPVRIEGPSLNVYPRRNLATSSDEVVLTQPGLTMRGRGLKADLARDVATLNSNVRTRYVPNSR